MKKYRITLIVTSVVLMVMLISSIVSSASSVPAVAVTRSVEQGIYNTIVCKGDVELKDCAAVTETSACIIKTAYVQEGDSVQAGQTLYDVVAAEHISPDGLDLEQAAEDLAKSGFSVPASLDIPMTVEEENYENAEFFSVTALQSGTVIDARKEGEYVREGAALCKIGDLKNLTVRAKIPESLINFVEAGQKANITGDAFQGKTYPATVAQIMPVAKKTISLTGVSSVAYVDVLLSVTASSAIRPGYTADVKIFTDYVKDAVLVPYECIFQEDREYVFAVEDNVLRKLPVETGYEITDGIQIREGLAGGALVVLDPDSSLQDGEKVNVQYE